MIFIIYAIFLIINILTTKTKYHIFFKTLNSFAFLGVAIYSAIMSDNVKLLYAMLSGLLFCVLGDFLLATSHKRSFIYGLLSFLIGNLCFIFYFTNFSPITIIEFIV
ncbi:MAG: lysoplasmalogenase family protein, partial [Coprobacillus sp.]